jgi:hypothetical protein
VLHCLPGDIASKGTVFTNLLPVVNPGAVIFGATLLSGGVRRNWFARKVMERNIAHGIFSNAADDLDGLHGMLAAHLESPMVEVVGCVAIFAGTAPIGARQTTEGGLPNT